MKRNQLVPHRHAYALLLLFCGIVFSTLTQAQQLQMKEFVLWGNQGVQLGTSSNVVNGGRVGSNVLIRSTGNATVNAHLNSGGAINLANSNTVNGNITAANSTGTTGAIFQTGSNAAVVGNTDVKGNIAIGGGSVTGNVVTSGTYSGPTPPSPYTVTQNGTPALPALPSFPAALTPVSYTTVQPAVTTTTTIKPGSYASLSLGGSKTVTFDSSGDYVFGSILNSGNFNKFVFNFRNNPNAVFRIFVTNNVDLYKISVDYLNLSINNAAPTTSDLASRILMQVNGTGAGSSTGYAWSITNGASGNNQSTWLGTVIAQNGSINVGSGSSQAKIIGALWSKLNVDLQSGVSITYAPLIAMCNAPAIKASGPTSFCQGSSVVFAASLASSYQWYRNTTELIPGATGQTYTATTAGKYRVVVDGGCASADSTVAVTTPPTATITYSGSPYCMSVTTAQPVMLTGTGAYTVGTYGATPAGLALNTTTGAITPSNSAAGVYSVSYTMPASGGCAAVTVSTSVTITAIPAKPTISVSGSTNICSGDSVVLTSSSATGNQWYTGSVAINGATTPTYIARAAGSYTVIVSVNSCSSPAADSVKVTINTAPPPVADAGPDKTITCPDSLTTIGTTNSLGSEYKWTAVFDGVLTEVGTTQTITVRRAGTYVLTVKNTCGVTAKDTAVVTYISCVLPINETPNGKVYNIIGSELTNLATDVQEAKKYLVILGYNDDSVLIEAIAKVGKELAARDTLWRYGIRDTVPNGISPLFITGVYPIAKLDLLLSPGAAEVLNHVRPVFAPLGNSGVVTSAGDTSLGANLVRNGYNVGGKGVKVGVISDSYNTLSGNPASIDVGNGDLPGTGNPDGDTTQVQVVLDYPYGRRTDEGRAMLQIVHDLAPKAPLAFRTGFISSGDMAYGILQLKDAGCKLIVDDVTYITEPFFKDGIVSMAVNQATSQGVTCFTSAGNFGSRSYTSTYNPVPAPGTFARSAHNFGGGDIYQHLRLKSGTYTIVLQWQDDIYSLGETTTGTKNDLDIYLVDPGGRIGFNRNNLGGDPLEVLSFSINLPDTSQAVDADLLIVKDDSLPGTPNPVFKYIIFRGNAVVSEYYSEQPLTNKSTIVGHANSPDIVTVGAVLWSNTPPYGVTSTIASFSSTGGTPVYNGSTVTVRAKPDLTAANGVNTSTSVVMGPDNDGSGHSDGFPNFFGTSAAAPHAAAVAALVLEAKKKFYNVDLTPAQLKATLFNTALAMQPDGVVGSANYKAGYGLVQPDAAVRSFANPTPHIDALVYNTSTITPGQTAFTLQVTGEYLTNNSQVYFRDSALTTTYVNANTLQTEIGTFVGNPSIRVYNRSFGNGASGDGGFSNTLYFFNTKKDTITIIADNKTKLYGERLPDSTTTILVNGDTLSVYNQKHGTSLTRAQLGVDSAHITYRYSNSTVNPLSAVGTYQIRASRQFDSTNQVDIGLLEKYQYDSTFGNLTITKLPVTIVPRDTTVVYGDALGNFHFNYVFPSSAKLANVSQVTSVIQNAHQQGIDNSVVGVINNGGGGGLVIFNGQVYPVYNNASVILNGKLYPVISNGGGGAYVIFNGQQLTVTNGGGGAYVIFNGEQVPVVNGGGGALVIFNGQFYPVLFDSNNTPYVKLNGVDTAHVVNGGGGAYVIFNGQQYPVTNGGGGALVIFNGEYYAVVNGGGGAYVIFNGQQLTVTNGGGGAYVIFNGTQQTPVLNGGGGAYVIFNDGSMLPVLNGGGGAYVIFNGNSGSTQVPVLNGGGGALVIFNGDVFPVLNGGAYVIFNGNYLPVLNGGGGAYVIFNGQQYPVTNGGGGAYVIFNGQQVPVISNGGGGAYVIFNGQALPVTNGGGGAYVIFNGNTQVPVVNSLSPQALANMSVMASAQTIANARTLTSGTTNKVVDISANAVMGLNSTPSQTTLFNATPLVNARGMMNAAALVNGGAYVIFNGGGGAIPIFNGEQTVLNSETVSAASKTRNAVIIDQADIATANSTSGATITLDGINIITGITAGTQTLIPATLLNSNFDITYGLGTVTINPSPITLTAKDTTKVYGDTISFTPTSFTLTSGAMKYGEKVSLVSLSSTGATRAAPAGNYPIVPSNALGVFGTAISNYAIRYSNGNLTVSYDPACLVAHSKFSSFASTPSSPTSLWLNIEVKISGQLANNGDYLMFGGGSITFTNISPAITNFIVKRGMVIADAKTTVPVSYYDSTSDMFITKVPPGFSSTSDIFISGAIISSSSGFKKNNTPSTNLSGYFFSNVRYSDQWSYGIAAYTPPTAYKDLSPSGSVVAVNGTYKAGTPMPWLAKLVSGGTGNGSSYTGSSSSNDNFTACQGAPSSGVPLNNSRRVDPAVVAADVLLEASLQVYPNPASSYTTVNFVPSVTGNSTITLFNINGSKVYELYNGTAEAGKVYSRRINTQALANGVYLIRVQEHGNTIIKKLVINNR